MTIEHNPDIIEQAVNALLTDKDHENLCHCDYWPERCVSGHTRGKLAPLATRDVIDALTALGYLPQPDEAETGRRRAEPDTASDELEDVRVNLAQRAFCSPYAKNARIAELEAAVGEANELAEKRLLQRQAAKKRARSAECRALELEEERAELQARIDKALALHSEFRIYDECGHKHEMPDGPDLPDGLHLIEDVGLVCEDGYQYSICRECCADDSYQTEACAVDHEHAGGAACWPCPTRAALASPGDPAESDPASDELEVKREAVREARRVISQYLTTAEKWRYDRVMRAFAIMLGEIPEDTPCPLSPADEEELRRRGVEPAPQAQRDALVWAEDDPEPPVGTVGRNRNGRVTWTRKDDGWHCGRPGCPACPTNWAEVTGWGGPLVEVIEPAPPQDDTTEGAQR